MKIQRKNLVPHNRRLVATLIAGSVLLTGSLANADNLTWVGEARDGTGDITDPANWATTQLAPVEAMPTTGDHLFFGYRTDANAFDALTLSVPEGTSMDLSAGALGGWRIGFRGIFDLRIIGGGAINGSQMHLGRWDSGVNSEGTLTLEGPGTTLTTAHETFIGMSWNNATADSAAKGTFNLNDGATYNHSGGHSFRVGTDQGKAGSYEGTININGVGNTLAVTNANAVLELGLGDTGGSGGSGLGTLNLNGGLVDLSTHVVLGRGNGGTGVLNLGNGTDASTFRAHAIVGGDGTSVVNFNNVTFEATEADANLISNVGTAEVHGGGLTIDTRGLNLSSTQAFTGSGEISLTNTAETESAFAFNGSHTGDLGVSDEISLIGEFSLDGSLTTSVGATFSPGNSIGTVAVGSALFENTLLLIEIDGNQIDLLNVTGDLDISSANLSLVQLGAPTEDLVFATYGGSLTGEFANIDGMQSGWSLDYNYGDTGSIALVIPEPSTYALLGGLGVLALALVCRNRRK